MCCFVIERWTIQCFPSNVCFELGSGFGSLISISFGELLQDHANLNGIELRRKFPLKVASKMIPLSEIRDVTQSDSRKSNGSVIDVRIIKLFLEAFRRL